MYEWMIILLGAVNKTAKTYRPRVEYAVRMADVREAPTPAHRVRRIEG